MVLKDKNSKYGTATMVPKKGTDSYAIKSMNRDIDKLIGHRRFILRSNQEPAIQDLKTSFKKISKADVMMEETPVGDSKSAGSIEN